MPKQVQLRRGTTTEHATFTGVVGEVTVDTTKDTVVVHDGTQVGGYPLARESDLANYQPLDGDLTAIAALSGTTGIVRKTAANTYSLDTDTYLTGITSTQVTTALGFTPYDATNPSGYLSTVNLTSNVTGALPVANGGTGATTLTGYVKGNGTSTMTASAAIPVADVTGAAPLASPTFTGTATTATLDALGSVRSNVTTVSASAIDCSVGNYFIKTASGGLTWTVTNVPTSRAYSFILELTNGGTGTQTWMSGIKWPSGTAPTLVASGVDVLGFITDDGGTTWRGVQLMKDSK
jgi:hypothetical protein